MERIIESFEEFSLSRYVDEEDGYELKKDIPYFYHVTLEKNIKSILRWGLNPNKFKYERSTSGMEIYVFESYDSARWYKSYMKDYIADDPKLNGKMVIFKIDAKGLDYQKDWTLSDSGEEDDAYVITSKVTPDRLTLIG
jgi:hypothetical protein